MQLEPAKFAKQQRCLEGILAIKQLPRVKAVCASDQGEVHYELLFSQDMERRRIVTGTVQGTIELTCQRCLKTMPFAFNVDVQLAVVYNDQQAKNLPEQYEPLMVEDEVIELEDLLADEILLAIPMVPKHA